MLEINPRLRMKKELINRNDHVIKLFKCDLLIFSLSEISNQFLTSWISSLIQKDDGCSRFELFQRFSVFLFLFYV